MLKTLIVSGILAAFLLASVPAMAGCDADKNAGDAPREVVTKEKGKAPVEAPKPAKNEKGKTTVE